MSKQREVDALAIRLEQATEAVLAVARECTQEQWESLVPEEKCTVGVLFRHMASTTPDIMWFVSNVATGKEIPVPQASQDRARQYNAEHAQKYAAVSKEEAIKLLEDTCADAVAQLRELTDEQLDIITAWRQPYEPVPEQDVASARLLIEWNLIYHRYDHLAQIKRVLGIN